MSRSKVRLLVAPFALLPRVGAAPWRSLPSCVLGKFSGITVTDPVGTIVGATAPSDWVCPGGTPNSPADVGHGPKSALVVRTLTDQDFSSGVFTMHWDGRDDAGARVPPGLYRAVLTTPDGTICGDIEIR